MSNILNYKIINTPIINSVEIEKNTYINEITDTLNEYLLPELQDMIKYYDKSVGTYLVIHSNNIICFRVPGATRGHIELKNNIIKDFIFYDTSNECYIGDYKLSVDKYIGSKLLF